LAHAGDWCAGTHPGANNPTRRVIEDTWADHWYGIIRLSFEFVLAEV
jgi:hypothetical protein